MVVQVADGAIGLPPDSEVTWNDELETSPRLADLGDLSSAVMSSWSGRLAGGSASPPSFGAALHRGKDGTKVTMYAQWRSIEDYQAMRENPAPLPFLQEALTFARFEPGMYEVVQTFRPSHESNDFPERIGPRRNYQDQALRRYR